MSGTGAASGLTAPDFPEIPPIEGVRLSVGAAAIKHPDRNDIMLAHLAPGTTVSGVFTRSATRAPSVIDNASKIGGPSDAAAAIFVNSGNANVFTGVDGDHAVQRIAGAVAACLDVPRERVLTASTGVIGERFPVETIERQIDTVAGALRPGGWIQAAEAIMTTDTFAKGAFREIEIDGRTVRIAGIAKGSGMIAPDMATMLAFVFTDAAVPYPMLQSILEEAVEPTFNSITVDGDTSTSDTVLFCATGKSAAITRRDRGFEAAVRSVMQDLAMQIVRDGEGASKTVEVRVTGAATPADAKLCAMAIANSPLVKTAIAGEDPNWGRVVMAVGKSGAAVERDRLRIWFDAILIAEKGSVAKTYVEEAAAAAMRSDEIVITVDLGLGSGESRVWTCDLTARYIEINADYRS